VGAIAFMLALVTVPAAGMRAGVSVLQCSSVLIDSSAQHNIKYT
jgi:hypothetical protein